MTHIVGQVLQIVAIIMVVWGIPRQIVKQYKDEQFGMDFIFSLIILAVYFFRAWYGILKHDWYLIVPDSIGFFLCAIVSWQYFNPRPWIVTITIKAIKKLIKNKNN